MYRSVGVMCRCVGCDDLIATRLVRNRSQASTLGSLEALLTYLNSHTPPVPVANVGLGPLHKKDITTASVMLEHKKEVSAYVS